MSAQLRGRVLAALGLTAQVAVVHALDGAVIEEHSFEVHSWRGQTADSLGDDCRKRNGLVTAADGTLSCLEVEVVRRLRAVDAERWQAAWVQAFPCGRNRWGEWIARYLPPAIGTRNRRIQVAIAELEHGRPSTSLAGHPDIAVARDSDVVYIECKTTDSLGPQRTWIETGLRIRAIDPQDVLVVRGVFVDRDASPPSNLARLGDGPDGRRVEVSPDRLDPALVRLVADADAAGNHDWVQFRDPIARFGGAATQPMLGWIRNGLHINRAIAVLEAIGRFDMEAGLAALDEAARSSPQVWERATEARSRLVRNSAQPARSVTDGHRKSGILDEVSGDSPPPAVGPCEFLTQKGRPCQNPGRYLVDGKWSCSRDHRR